VLIIAAVLMTALLGIAVLAVDGAFLMNVRAELQRATDAMSVAAASGLTVGLAEATQRAEQYAQLNPVLGESLDVEGQQMVFGLWEADSHQFIETSGAPNSVRVTARLTGGSTPAEPSLFFGPVLGRNQSEVEATSTAALGNRNMVLTLDRSGSMNDDNANPEQPLTDTKEAAKRFLDLVRNFPVDGDQAGLVFYNHQATLNQQLTDNFNQVKTAIDGPTALDWTNIAAALCVARQETLSSRADPRGIKVIILLSDGKTNSRVNAATCQLAGTAGQDDGQPPGNVSEQQALAQAQLIAQDRTILYTISLGLNTNRPLMQQMAQVTGGEHFFAPTTADLQHVFDEISARIPVALVE